MPLRRLALPGFIALYALVVSAKHLAARRRLYHLPQRRQSYQWLRADLEYHRAGPDLHPSSLVFRRQHRRYAEIVRQVASDEEAHIIDLLAAFDRLPQ